MWTINVMLVKAGLRSKALWSPLSSKPSLQNQHELSRDLPSAQAHPSLYFGMSAQDTPCKIPAYWSTGSALWLSVGDG